MATATATAGTTAADCHHYHYPVSEDPGLPAGRAHRRRHRDARRGQVVRGVLKASGWIDDFDADGTDDTVMKHLLADALVRTNGHATIDDWAAVWLDRWDDIFGAKLNKFFPSVTHTAHKLRRHSVPRMAALGNMPSSSTAMCFSPVGIVNAGNPRGAALQGYNLAALIHGHDVGFCQDGAVAMAAGVAEAFRVSATVESVVEAAQANIIATSGAEMLDHDRALPGAGARGRQLRGTSATAPTPAPPRCSGASAATRARRCRSPWPCSSWPAGDVERCVTYGANFGRDADTIASMCGALAGALQGVDGIREDWVEKAQRLTATDQQGLTRDLVRTTLAKRADQEAALAELALIT